MELETAAGIVLGMALGIVYSSLWWKARTAELTIERLSKELGKALDEDATIVETFPLGGSGEAL